MLMPVLLTQGLQGLSSSRAQIMMTISPLFLQLMIAMWSQPNIRTLLLLLLLQESTLALAAAYLIAHLLQQLPMPPHRMVLLSMMVQHHHSQPLWSFLLPMPWSRRRLVTTYIKVRQHQRQRQIQQQAPHQQPRLASLRRRLLPRRYLTSSFAWRVTLTWRSSAPCWGH